MNFVSPALRKLSVYEEIIKNLDSECNFSSLGFSRAVKVPFLATLSEDINKPILIITDRADHARVYAEELSFWLPNDPIVLFPEPTPLFYENTAWNQETRLGRVRVLTDLSRYHLPKRRIQDKHPIIVSSIRAVMTRTISRRDFLKAISAFKVGDQVSPNSLIIDWLRIGYISTDTVLEPGQMAHRGGIIDVWSPTESKPYRLDFFGNEIDNIRSFDPLNQRTIESINDVVIPPSREFIPTDNMELLADSLSELNEFHIPIVHPFSSTILDYLPGKSVIVYSDKELIASNCADIEEESVRLRKENIKDGSLNDDYPVPYKSWSEIEDHLSNRVWINLGNLSAQETQENCEQLDSDQLSSLFKPGPRFAGKVKSFTDHLLSLINEKSQILIVSRQADRLKKLIRGIEQQDLDESVLFFDSSLSEGWILRLPDGKHIYLFTDSEIFGWERPKSRTQPRVLFDSPESNYADLIPGEWVVHVDYGIGLFLGLVERLLDGITREFLLIEYRNGDQVFVPIHQADRITPYVGVTGKPPNLGSLGTQEWTETKKRVEHSVQDIAVELLDLYAKRQLASGHAFKTDSQWQIELENSFPYIETEDQIKVLEEVKRDMEAIRPMDRLLCGDVGYGKTEVALRAAFKAVMDGKQVAVLVPTTVLAQQHFDTFKQRLSTFPVSVEMLSRFRSHSEQRKILDRLEVGQIDIIIGTHRLVQKDVNFKDLGLVIIDEEQRFGVTHKEFLKQLRNEIDVLTLTATPIPRTLYMALTGIRDISQLNTPPDERLPVVTHIGPYSQKLVRQAIHREMERGGQIFFVHNRVQTIEAMKMHLNKLVPEARVGIGHGQMPEKQLSAVMRQFTSGEIHILLCTSIIESGLDIPNANTLIVDRGDTFGLAQLYQLRGRVGRGATRAYAYFFRHKKKTPTIDGQERLETIAENYQLGSGYSIAMRDLEMRGAGDLLGSRQHGYIAAIGFHLYTRLLASAIKAKRNNIGLTLSIDEDLLFKELGIPVNVELPFDSGIPSTYIKDKGLRLKLYRRIATISNESDLDALIGEFNDRFGPPPDPVKNLFFQIKVKIKARLTGLSSISFDRRQIIFRFSQGNTSNNNQIASKSEGMPKIKMPGIRTGKNAYWMAINDENKWQTALMKFMEELVSKTKTSEN